jgi:hypothetical protein
MEVVDSEGVVIHNDIVQDNQYGPAIPGIDILQNLSNFTDNCFLTSGLNRSDSYEQYQKIENGTCDISDKLTDYDFRQDIRTTDVPSSTVPKLRILLKELHELNEKANDFFTKREEKAVEILDKSKTPDTEYSLRLNYMNRRDHTASSNSIALIIYTIIAIFTLFTGGYLYFIGKLQSPMDYIIVTLPIAIWVISIMLGYVFITRYSLFLS